MAQTDLINEGLLADYHDELMKTHLVGGVVFDISAYKASGTPLTPAKFADLAAALGTNGANVPVPMRKGGMSVKFIQSSDNKYVQFRYMGTSTADADFTNTVNWQGVDDEPTAGSDNLVKSGGVYEKIAYNTTFLENKAAYSATAFNFIKGHIYKINAETTGAYLECSTRNTPTGSDIDVINTGSFVTRKIVTFIPTANAAYFYIKRLGGAERVTIKILEVGSNLQTFISSDKQNLSNEEKAQVLDNLGLVIDSVPTANSNNLVKSGGVKAGLMALDRVLGTCVDFVNKSIVNNGVPVAFDNGYRTSPINVVGVQRIYNVSNDIVGAYFFTSDELTSETYLGYDARGYVLNGARYCVLNGYVSGGIAPESITYSLDYYNDALTKDIRKSSNVCSSLVEYHNKSINAQGELVDAAGYVSFLFEIKPGTNYAQKSINYLAYYNRNGVFVSRPTIFGTNITTPSNAYFARIVTNRPVSQWQLNEGNVLLDYEPTATGIYPYTDKSLALENVPADGKTTGDAIGLITTFLSGNINIPKSEMLVGKAINNGAIINAGPAFYITKPFYVGNIKKIQCNNPDIGNFAFWKSSDINADNLVGAYYNNNNIVPNGAQYCIASFYNSNNDSQGSAIQENTIIKFNELEKKTCLYIGDSISTNDNYYWKGLLESHYGLNWVRSATASTNAHQEETTDDTLWPADGGIRVIPPITESEYNYQKSIWYRCANNRMSIYDFDVISLFGGTNDMSPELELGTYTDTPYLDTTEERPETLTYASALKGCIEMLKRDFPSKDIYVCTVFPCGGSFLSEDEEGVTKGERMAMLQMQIVDYYRTEKYWTNIFAVPFYWDMRTNHSYKTKVFSKDTVHPNYAWARRMMTIFAESFPLQLQVGITGKSVSNY